MPRKNSVQPERWELSEYGFSEGYERGVDVGMWQTLDRFKSHAIDPYVAMRLDRDYRAIPEPGTPPGKLCD